MKAVLYNYDIYPLVFPVGKQVTLTVKPLGDHAAFSGEYRVLIHRVDAGNPNMALYSRNKTEYAVTPDADGCLRILCGFIRERNNWLSCPSMHWSRILLAVVRSGVICISIPSILMDGKHLPWFAPITEKRVMTLL